MPSIFVGQVQFFFFVDLSVLWMNNNARWDLLVPSRTFCGAAFPFSGIRKVKSLSSLLYYSLRFK